jgi:flagellum-specific peptidoglycan hydrolase FlgJ
MSSLLTLLWLAVLRPAEPLKPHVVSYIETHMYLAIDEMERSGIPASITMAQAIIETDGGTSRLARESNNHFGIKCKSYWQGPTVQHPDDDRDATGRIIPSCFRAYPTVMDSYKDHTDFLVNTTTYQALFQYPRTDYENWARGLQYCGYATDARYAEKLIATIERYGLAELDYYTIQFVPRSALAQTNN